MDVFPGKDGLVRSVNVQVEHVIVPTNTQSKTDFVKKLKTRTAIYRRPITKLSMLLPSDEVFLWMDQIKSQIFMDQTSSKIDEKRAFHGGECVGAR